MPIDPPIAVGYCDQCGCQLLEDDYYSYCADCDARTCEDCNHEDSSSYEGSGSPVRSWDYKPHPYSPKGNYPAEPLLGVELEVGGSNDDIVPAVHAVDDCGHHLYMKEDGSISGVEIVTHPMTLAWSRGFDFEGLLDGLRRNDAYVNDGYGLHVHVSRNAFRRLGKRSAPHQMAWLMFMYRNPEHLQELARRDSSRWASFRKPKRGELRRKAVSDRSNDDRYVAVNCNNDKTYELRFFQSTLNIVELRAAIEFADASVEYTRGIKTADILRGDALKWSHFEAWVEESEYPNLAMELGRISGMADEPHIFTNGEIVSFALPAHLIRLPDSVVNENMSLAGACGYVGEGGRITRSALQYEVEHGGMDGWQLREVVQDRVLSPRPIREFARDDWHALAYRR